MRRWGQLDSMRLCIRAICDFIIKCIRLQQTFPKKFHPSMQFVFPKRVFGSTKKEEKSFRAYWRLWHPCTVSLPRVLKANKEGTFMSSTERCPALGSKGCTSLERCSKCVSETSTKPFLSRRSCFRCSRSFHQLLSTKAHVVSHCSFSQHLYSAEDCLHISCHILRMWTFSQCD